MIEGKIQSYWIWTFISLSRKIYRKFFTSAYANFHDDFIKGRITLIGCPKLDEGDYAEKLTEILRQNDIKSVTVVRMEVPCCGGIENAVMRALQSCGKMIQWQVVTISTDGRVLEGQFCELSRQESDTAQG